MKFRQLRDKLLPLYDEREAKAVARYVLEERFGLTPGDIYVQDDLPLTDEQSRMLEQMADRLAAAEPVQYVLGEAWFCNRRFVVSPSVLIPRPETERLCGMIVDDAAHGSAPMRVFDACTGSGCIAVTLALELKEVQVSACDLSGEALTVAQANARRWGVEVEWRRMDVLHIEHDAAFRTSTDGTWDIIVSNPPYICLKEKKEMARNVLAHEPSMALFVPDDDPTLFYRSLARWARHALNSKGKIYLETNPLYVDDVQTVLEKEGLCNTKIHEDDFGKRRFVTAQVADF